MFSIRRDFGLFGKMFGVPRAWLSRIGAFCASWTVEGNILNLVIPEFPDPVKNPIRLSIDADALRDLLGAGAAGTVKSVDGHSPDSDGAVSFGLASGRIVMTDSSGHLSAVSTAPVASASITVVTSVDWDSANHRLTRKTRTLTFTHGVLTNAGTESAAGVIDTATLIRWS